MNIYVRNFLLVLNRPGWYRIFSIGGKFLTYKYIIYGDVQGPHILVMNGYEEYVLISGLGVV